MVEEKDEKNEKNEDNAEGKDSNPLQENKAEGSKRKKNEIIGLEEGESSNRQHLDGG